MCSFGPFTSVLHKTYIFCVHSYHLSQKNSLLYRKIPKGFNQQMLRCLYVCIWGNIQKMTNKIKNSLTVGEAPTDAFWLRSLEWSPEIYSFNQLSMFHMYPFKKEFFFKWQSAIRARSWANFNTAVRQSFTELTKLNKVTNKKKWQY